MIPQIIMIALFAMGLGVNISKHGQQKDQRYNGFTHVVFIIINSIILYYGGFWNAII